MSPKIKATLIMAAFTGLFIAAAIWPGVAFTLLLLALLVLFAAVVAVVWWALIEALTR